MTAEASRFAVSKLKLRNIRRFNGPHEFNFTAPDTRTLQTIIFAGPNGCGKTTLLESILLMLGKRALIARGERASLVPSLDPLQSLLSFVSISVEDAHAKKNVEISNPLDTYIEDDWREINQFDHYTDARYIADNIEVEYYSSWRAPALSGGIKPLGKGNRRAENDVNRLHNIKQRIIDQRAKKGFRINAESKDDLWLKKLNTFWSKFRRDNTFIDADYIDDINNEDPYFDLFLYHRNNEQTIRLHPIDALSSGELELVQLAGSLITREVPLDILVLDEPELHLHPQWQRGLLPALRALLPSTQLIIATHSDAIWDHAMSYERFLLNTTHTSS